MSRDLSRPAARSSRRRPARKSWRPAYDVLEGRIVLSTAVTVYHGNPASTGLNATETSLTPANVNTSTFGKLFTTPLDGQVYAQPLYVPNVTITTGQYAGVHDVTYVVTEHDSLYAIDSTSGTVLWRDSFINPSAGVTTEPSTDFPTVAITPEIGITGTPVIDPSSNTIYFVAATKEVVGGANHYVNKLHAISLANGAEVAGGPVVIGDTTVSGTTFTYNSGPSVRGTGDGSVNGVVTFNAFTLLQRPGLALVNGTVYIAFGSHDDNPPYHGWILGYNASTLALNGVFNATPNGSDGAFWMSGGSIAVDSSGALYASVGNGTFDAAASLGAHADYSDSVLKIVADTTTTAANPGPNGWGLKVADYFTPSNEAYLNSIDGDVGSGGVTILPDSVGSAAHPHLLITVAKKGNVYLIDRDNMGGFNPAGDQIVQEQVNPGQRGLFTPSYFNGSLYWSTGGELGVSTPAVAFAISDGAFQTTPSSQSADVYGYPGVTPTISANGTTNGILWTIDTRSNQLRAYDATNLAHELYTSAQQSAGLDALEGAAVKFSVPTVADGRVLVGTANSLDGYGLLSTIAADADFVGSDTVNKGNWKGAYGQDGHDVVGDSASIPSYAIVTPSAQAVPYTWNGGTTDPRALQPAGSSTNRTAATWFNNNSFTIDVQLTDGRPHQVSVYALDWDSKGRSERVDIINPTSGRVLDTQTISSFVGGEYLTWTLTGHVQIQVTHLAGANAVLSGIFLGGSTPAATFTSSDTTTKGNWKGAYGADGYNILNDLASIPNYATITPAGQNLFDWTLSTSDPRALQKADPGATDRIAAGWTNYTHASPFSFDVNFTDHQSHQLSIYAIDWDNGGRTERFDVIDPATGTVLDTRTISSFVGGEYLTWTLSGHVEIRVTPVAGPNAVISGIFFGGSASSASASATYVGSDATTAGTWKGAYGANGYDVVGDSASIPGYATVTPAGQTLYTWAASTTDARALQKGAAGATDRIAATWFNPTSFTVDVNLTDGQAHRVSIYALDWDSKGRSERVDIIDPTTNAVLDTETISSFSGGRYLTWNLSGHVQIRVTDLSGPNAVLSGLFFG